MSGTLEALQYAHGKLKIIDQLLLPHYMRYIDILNTQDGWRAIRDMQVGLICACVSCKMTVCFLPANINIHTFGLPCNVVPGSKKFWLILRQLATAKKYKNVTVNFYCPSNY